MQHIHITEYYSAIKWNKVLTYVTTWVNLENIKLTEISQSQNWYTGRKEIFFKSIKIDEWFEL